MSSEPTSEDGLRLEWEVITSNYSQCRAVFAKYQTEYDPNVNLWFRSVNGRGFERCGSYENAKSMCLNDEKERFRAELEKAVKS